MAICLVASTSSYGQGTEPRGSESLRKPFSVSCLHYQDSIRERPLEEAWIQMDAERIESIFNRVPAYGSTLDSLILLLPNLLNGKGNAVMVQDDLGDSLQLIRYTLYGGYGSMRFEILHSGNRVLRINQYLSNYAELIGSRFLPLVQVPLFCDYGYAENLTLYPHNIAGYRNRYPDFYLHSLIKEEGNKDAEALLFFSDYSALRSYFMSPMHVTEEYWSPAFGHIRHLVENKKTELLEKLLYSPLASGRVFATSALHYLEENGAYFPGERTNERMQEIKNGGTVFTSGILSCWMNRFEYDYIDVYSNFRKLLEERE